jgi:hypothetical protein
MLIFTVLEVHPGFMIAYPPILAFLGLASGSAKGKQMDGIRNNRLSGRRILAVVSVGFVIRI